MSSIIQINNTIERVDYIYYWLEMKGKRNSHLILETFKNPFDLIEEE